MKENDIRPVKIFQEYLRLSSEDSKNCFPKGNREEISCPACNSLNKEPEFKKNGFSFSSCKECGSLFLNPRPTKEAFDNFYKDSKSSKYWAEHFYPSTAESRRKNIFQPRVKRIQKLCLDNNFNPSSVMDVGSGYGIFLEEWKKINPKTELIGVEPSKHLAKICRDKNINVLEEVVEEVTGFDQKIELLVCFEVFEHIHNPKEFIEKLKELIKPNGYIVLSTLTISGFDLQLLWENSNSISPPHHINFLSIKGFEHLFRQCGFKNINIFTPGVLDVDIVKNAYNENISVAKKNRFLEEVFKDERKSRSFQNYLSENQMSSHVWIMAQK